jgi:4-hydroxybenzoate polyprenyltransferase
MLDVILLASFYAYRVWVGGVVTEIVISPWLMGFSIFVFLDLALLKRYADLLQARQLGLELPRRAYRVEDIEVLRGLGAAAGYLAVLVLALYINSTAVVALYRHPQVLWLMCPCLLYWLSRIWILANRGQMTTDPVVFAIRDRASYAVAGLMLLILLAAR